MTKHYSRDEAEALLPRLEPLLRTLQMLRERHIAVERQLLASQRKILGNGHSQNADTSLTNEMRLLETQITEGVQELVDLGVVLKDIQSGLIDFPAEMGGREIFLCWQVGEPHIGWWHERDSGFAGRQPLPDPE